MDPDLDAEHLATFGNLEIEIGRECDVAVVWNGVFDWDSCSPPTCDDVEVKVFFVQDVRDQLLALLCRYF